MEESVAFHIRFRRNHCRDWEPAAPDSLCCFRRLPVPNEESVSEESRRNVRRSHSYSNGNGKTSLPMNSVTDTFGNLRSRKLPVNWYDMRIMEAEKRME